MIEKGSNKNTNQRINQLELILSSLDTGLFIINSDLTISWANEKIYQMVPGADPVGQICHRFFESSDHPCEQCPTFKCFKSKSVEEIERFSPVTKRWYRVISQPISDSDGQVVSVLEGVTDITERKEEEKAILQERNFLKTILETSPETIIVVNREGQLKLANAMAEKTLGLKRSDIYRLRYNDPDWRIMDFEGNSYPEEKLPFQIVKLTGEPVYGIEHAIEWPDGKLVFLSINAAPLFDNNGNFDGMVSVIEDVTERKRAEENLRKSEERYRIHFESVLDVIYTLDTEFKLLDISPSVEGLLGYKPKELIGRPFQDLNVLAPEYLEQAFSDCMRILEGERIPSTVYQFIARDGTKIWGEMNGSPVIRDNQVVAITSVARDITERKLVEERLRITEEHYREAQRMAKVGHWTFDPLLQEFSGSPEANRIYGFPADAQASLEDIATCISEAERDRVLGALFALVQEGKAFNEEFAICPRDSNDTKILWSMARVHVDPQSGSPVVKGVLQDITEHKIAEAERETLQAQFLQAQKMESVGRLAGGVAHDYNNALSVIIGFTELAMDEVEQAGPLRTDLEEVLSAAKRATNITRQLLAFARKQTIAPKVLDLNDNVESMLQMLQRLIGEDISLAWLPGASLWPVKIDPTQIDQILANLCVNARDAIENVGKISIETSNVSFDNAYCAVHKGFVPGEFVLLAVSDNGCGIDKEILDKIFEPFFTTKDVDKGTGLGMSTVYGIVKQNNGFINVYSEPGEGTTIKIYLPRHEVEFVEIQEKSTAEIPQSQGETVLLVEDDISILKLATKILDRLGYTVLTAETPEKVIDLAKEHSGKIDLLITDVIMPGMNGSELSQKIQSLYPDLKCVFMSGYTADIIAHHGVLDEGMYFIQKPFSKRNLALTVRKALDE
jgi:two-component system cell cycle sensor histidine kinase/response regulator CckA